MKETQKKESFNTDPKDTRDLETISQSKKFGLILVFIVGIALSYPTVLPLGLTCSAILLFQTNNKMYKLGYFLILIQILIMFGALGIWGLLF